MSRRRTVAISLFLLLSTSACSEESRLRSKCMGGDVAKCVELGDMYMTGNRVAVDIARAAEMYEQACTRGAADACNAVGEIYEKGLVLNSGMARAEEMFRAACGGGNAAGCTNLGLALSAADQKKEAVSLFERACTAGWTPGCHHLAVSYERGEGVIPDVPRAITLYDDACANKYLDSCIAVGTMYMTGDRVTADKGRAAGYFGTAIKVLDDSCQAGTQRDCTERDKLRSRVAVMSMR